MKEMLFYQKLIMLVVVLSFATLWIWMYLKAYYGSDDE